MKYNDIIWAGQRRNEDGDLISGVSRMIARGYDRSDIEDFGDTDISDGKVLVVQEPTTGSWSVVASFSRTYTATLPNDEGINIGCSDGPASEYSYVLFAQGMADDDAGPYTAPGFKQHTVYPFMRDLDLCERNGFRCDSLISAVELDCANPGCEGADRNCKLSACWELTPDRKAYTFHMRVNGAEWGGIGFNERQLMTGTDLYWLGKEDGAPVVKSLYASETNIPKPHTGSDGKEVTGEPYVNVLSAVSYDNDYLEASWTVPIKVSQSDRDGSRTRADLAKGNELFAIFAVGKGAWPVFQYHSDKGTTSQKVDIFRQGDPAVAEAIAVNSGSMISTGKAAHGILMIVAWVVLSPLATFTARYLKFAGPIWFRSHRNMQVVAYVLTIVALIIIVLELNAEGKDFSTLTDNPEAGGYSKTHGSLGLAVIGMSSLQVLLGIFRNQISGFDAKEQHDDPNYHGPRRYIFNYAHWFNGWSLLVISITTVYFGLNTSCCGVDIPATDVLLTFIGLAVGPIVLAMECFKRGQNAEENENTMAKHVFALACAASVATGVTIIVIIVNGTAPAK